MQSESNEPFHFALKYMSGPIFLVALIIGIKSQWEGTLIFTQRNGKKVGRIGTWFLLVIITGVGTVLSTGWVLTANAIIPPQENVLIEGTVSNKRISRGRSTSYHVIVSTVSRTYDFNVTSTDYNAETVGRPYHHYWIRGGLGLLYRYKY